MRVICAWCSTFWDADEVLRDGWELLSDRQAVELDVLRQFAHARSGDEDLQRETSRQVHAAVVAGRGCPSAECGFEHGPEAGPHRQQQVEEMADAETTGDES